MMKRTSPSCFPSSNWLVHQISAILSMASEIFIFDFDRFFFDFDQKMMKIVPILSIYSSTFGQMAWSSMRLPTPPPPPQLYYTMKGYCICYLFLHLSLALCRRHSGVDLGVFPWGARGAAPSWVQGRSPRIFFVWLFGRPKSI